MTLPIQWRVLPGPFHGHLLLTARLDHNGTRFEKKAAMPPVFNVKTWWLMVAAMQAEITNAVEVKNPPAV